MAKSIKIVTLTTHKTIIRLEEAKKVLSPKDYSELNKLITKLIEYDITHEK